MYELGNPVIRPTVALLAEGVDRNSAPLVARLFSRRRVALLAEGVDRNSEYQMLASITESRPPRGGRG